MKLSYKKQYEQLNYKFKQSSNEKYCVYRVIYTGRNMKNDIDLIYIGSTFKNNILLNNYRGSVSSKQYQTIYYKELIEQPELFTIEILSEHNTRKEAYEEERRLHIELGVIGNKQYINAAIAIDNTNDKMLEVISPIIDYIPRPKLIKPRKKSIKKSKITTILDMQNEIADRFKILYNL